jgi:hypothetical protein
MEFGEMGFGEMSLRPVNSFLVQIYTKTIYWVGGGEMGWASAKSPDTLFI